MPIKVGRTPYLSSEPMYFDMDKRGIEVEELPPNEMVEAILAGRLQGGLVPLVDVFDLDDSLRTVSGFCIATTYQAVSVKLHSKTPIEELSGSNIAISRESPTAIKLLQVLLTLKHGIKPGAYVTEDDPHEARLLVGNLGLRHRRGLRGFDHTYDLGEEWTGWTKLPFVFARWVLRTDLDRQDALVIEDSLYTSLQDWADGLYRVSGPSDRVPVHPQEIHQYTQGLRYYIGVPEERSMTLFKDYLTQLNQE
ncbi:MAG: MqnA/MqnD/SBP family protein [Dehalococcoidia bacterium]